MKILFIIDSLTAGGKERRFTELLKGLHKEKRIHFELVVMNKDIHYREIFSLCKNIHYLVRKSKKDLSVFPKFFKICKKYRPDIVHSWDDMTSIIATPACFFLRLALVNGMVVDTPVVRNISNKYWLRGKLTFPFSKKIIGNSMAGLKAYGAPAKKSLCIYNGIDFERFQDLKDPANLLKKLLPDDSDKEIFIIGMVAAFEPRKDYQTLIKAANQLLAKNDTFRFMLVGDGTEIDYIKSLVPKNLARYIVFLGKRNDVESIVNLFDLGVLLTNSKNHGEGISNSILEYMALEKPVIATIGGGTSEIVQDKVSGYLIQDGNVDQFIDYVTHLKENIELRTAFGKAGKQIVLSNFNLGSMTKNYIELYREILNPPTH